MVKNEWARCNDHCPVWEKLDCKSYLVVTKEKNYNAAKADCVSMGAKLVEPKDKKVNDFVDPMHIQWFSDKQSKMSMICWGPMQMDPSANQVYQFAIAN